MPPPIRSGGIITIICVTIYDIPILWPCLKAKTKYDTIITQPVVVSGHFNYINLIHPSSDPSLIY